MRQSLYYGDERARLVWLYVLLLLVLTIVGVVASKGAYSPTLLWALLSGLMVSVTGSAHWCCDTVTAVLSVLSLLLGLSLLSTWQQGSLYTARWLIVLALLACISIVSRGYPLILIWIAWLLLLFMSTVDS
jgi:hypothetical protein